ncbi:MAG: PaaI family thioesterase [Holophagales bacterium]|nr:PaaI family thioesterase [Gammaproteobacteria bacterium]MYF05475.1 PaaI family thioesterase [Holophagales bacterium]
MNIDDLPQIPSREFMGGAVQSVEDDGSRASVRFRPPEGMTNPHGTVQGGFVAAMVDDTVSLATWFAGGERTFVTSSLSCFYLRPVPAGVGLLVTCELVRVGQRQAVFEAVVQVDGDHTPLVKAVQIQSFL